MAEPPARPAVAVVGASGYTGSELVRLLVGHPDVELGLITSESHAGRSISDIHPHLKGICDMVLEPLSALGGKDPDLVFLALPHGVSMGFVKEHAGDRFRVIDLSGDFRLKSKEDYETWYRLTHICPDNLGRSAYGLPELFRGVIASSDLVANPGCYPTSAILGLAPLLIGGLVENQGIIVDSKSGVTGAGAKPKPLTHYPHANEDLKAYGLGTHRHTPEMEEILNCTAEDEVGILFTPHLAPMNRGILTTAYCRAKDGTDQCGLEEAYASKYGEEPFIRLRGEPPSVRDVRGSNYCDIHVKLDERTGTVIAVSAIDNLVKGAAGQAVQNMNIMLGFRETAGLEAAPLSP